MFTDVNMERMNTLEPGMSQKEAFKAIDQDGLPVFAFVDGSERWECRSYSLDEHRKDYLLLWIDDELRSIKSQGGLSASANPDAGQLPHQNGYAAIKQQFQIHNDELPSPSQLHHGRVYTPSDTRAEVLMWAPLAVIFLPFLPVTMSQVAVAESRFRQIYSAIELDAEPRDLARFLGSPAHELGNPESYGIWVYEYNAIEDDITVSIGFRNNRSAWYRYGYNAYIDTFGALEADGLPIDSPISAARFVFQLNNEYRNELSQSYQPLLEPYSKLAPLAPGTDQVLLDEHARVLFDSMREKLEDPYRILFFNGERIENTRLYGLATDDHGEGIYGFLGRLSASTNSPTVRSDETRPVGISEPGANGRLEIKPLPARRPWRGLHEDLHNHLISKGGAADIQFEFHTHMDAGYTWFNLSIIRFDAGKRAEILIFKEYKHEIELIPIVAPEELKGRHGGLVYDSGDTQSGFWIRNAQIYTINRGAKNKSDGILLVSDIVSGIFGFEDEGELFLRAVHISDHST